MSIYWKTPTGYGISETDDSVPEVATVITEDQYNAIIAATKAELQTVIDQATAESNRRWTLVHDSLVAAGVSEDAATVLANVAGIKP